jgi:5-methylthioadenosine/S-adenosylhomocysteine deaminase
VEKSMPEADLVLKADWIITHDRPGIVFKNAAVAIKGNSICDVGAAQEVANRTNAKRVMDYPGKAILPGLVDCHVHTCQQLARGLADEVPVSEWLARIVPFEAEMDETDVHVSVQAACIEMIKSGTTGFMEACANPLHIDAAATAMEASGLRVNLTRSTMDLQQKDWTVPHPFLMSTEKHIAETTAMIRRWNGAASGRMSAWCGWRHRYDTSGDLLIALVKLAREHGVGLHGHLSTRHYGEVDDLDRLGVLGPDFLLAHAIRYTARELELIKRYDVKIDHNPGASMHGAYGSAVAGQFPEMLDRDICVGLGCDAAPSGNFLDMIEAVRLAATLHKEVRQNASLITASKALFMGTTDGARACGWKDVGVIAPGKKADIIVVDMMQPHLLPVHDVISNLVYCAKGSDVVTNIVDGRILMENRRVLSFDEHKVLTAAIDRAERVKARWSHRPRHQ